MKIVNPIAKLGEDKACDYIENLGYKIIERNFRKGYGEIDIVALDNNVLAFIEVKTRTSNLFGTPLESITYWKLKTLIKTAEYYKLTHKNLPDELRIDVISILISNNKVSEIDLIKNISGF